MSTIQAKSFAEILTRRNSLLARNLEEIRARAAEDWIHFLGDDHGSHTGYVHLRNVERNADKIVPGACKESFSDGEIFLLLAAILLHDIGKIVPKDVPVDPLACSNPEAKWGFRCPLKEWGHHCASKRLIDEQWAVLGLPDAHIAGYCGLLAYSHGAAEPLDKAPTCLGDSGCVLENPMREDFRNTSLEPYGDLRIPLLAAILRIADETENSWTRALRREAFSIYRKSGRNLYKAFRRNVEDVSFSHEGRCVIMHVPGWTEPDADEEYSILDSLAYTGKKAEKVVRAWSGALKPIDAVFSRVLFEHGGRLYHDPYAGFREPPPLTEAFRAEEDAEIGGQHPELREDEPFIQRCLATLKEETQGSGGGQRISLSSIEASLDRPMDEHQRWIVERMGEVHPGLRVEKGRQPGDMWLSLDLHRLAQVERSIGSVSVKPLDKDEKEQEENEKREKEEDTKFCNTILDLFRGTYGHRSFSWAVIEAEVGHRMETCERWRLLHLSDHFSGIEVKIDPEAAGRLIVKLDSTKRVEEKDWKNELVEKTPEQRLKELTEIVNRTSQMTQMTKLSWPMIEAELGRSLTSEDHAVLEQAREKNAKWQTSSTGLFLNNGSA